MYVCDTKYSAKKDLHKSESRDQSDCKSQACKNGLKLPKAHEKVMNKMIVLKKSWRKKTFQSPSTSEGP